jgi:hypothetical protein
MSRILGILSTNHLIPVILFLVFFIFPVHAFGGEVTFTWDANTEPDLAGYIVYYGTSSGNYTRSVDVGNNTEYTQTELQDGVTYYFASTAYDTAGNESGFSNQIVYIADSQNYSPGPCDVFVPGPDWCKDCGPCAEGEGDCDGDVECEAGLICAQDVGANYGWPPSRDVCEQPSGGAPCDVFVPGPDWCKDCGPCAEGQGDCDGDVECEAGLICAQDVGANYGWPPSRDVCESP